MSDVMKYVLLTHLVWIAVTSIFTLIRDCKSNNEKEAKRLSESMLRKFVKYGRVSLQTRVVGLMDLEDDTVYVFGEKKFWRVFNEFNRLCSEIYGSDTIQSSIKIEIDKDTKKKLFHYTFEKLDLKGN